MGLRVCRGLGVSGQHFLHVVRTAKYTNSIVPFPDEKQLL